MNKLFAILVFFMGYHVVGFAQVAKSEVRFIKQQKNTVNVFQSNGFNGASAQTNLRMPSPTLAPNEVNFGVFIKEEINEMDLEALNMAYNHANQKLQRAILLGDILDIARYQGFVNDIIARLKEMGEIL